MVTKIEDFLTLLLTGILSLLWFDLRRIGKERAKQKDEIAGQIKEMKVCIDEKYLPRDTHELLCKNTLLRVEAKIDALKIEVIREIKKQ